MKTELVSSVVVSAVLWNAKTCNGLSGSEYTGSAPREDLSGLLKTFGRDAVEVDRFMSENVPEQQGERKEYLNRAAS